MQVHQLAVTPLFEMLEGTAKIFEKRLLAFMATELKEAILAMDWAPIEVMVRKCAPFAISLG